MKNAITLQLINAQSNNDNTIHTMEVGVDDYSFKPVQGVVIGETTINTLLLKNGIAEWQAVETFAEIGELLKDDVVVESIEETIKPYSKMNAKELADECTKRGLGFTLENSKKELVAILEADDAAKKA